MPTSAFHPGDPFCTQCGYLLIGHEADARCPECEAPLPAALGRYDPRKDAPTARGGRRSRSSATLLGWPLVDIALGPDPDTGGRGHARGVIAIGDTAVGGLAIGGGAVGIVAIGGGAIGVVTVAGGAVGLLAALGGGALGGIASGGIAAGGIATGGVALGYLAQGGVASGVYARGGKATGSHTITPLSADPAAVQRFNAFKTVVGPSTPSGMPAPQALLQGLLVHVLLAGVLAAVIGALVLAAQRRHDRRRGLRDLAAAVADDPVAGVRP